MTTTRMLIDAAVRQYPLETTPAWQSVTDGNAALSLDHIEPETNSFTTTDCLFDGKATIVLKDARALQAEVFGHFDSRRAEIDHIKISK